MKYQVVYTKLKKKGFYSKQKAVFFDVRDAMLWERFVNEKGCKNVEIVPLFD